MSITKDIIRDLREAKRQGDHILRECDPEIAYSSRYWMSMGYNAALEIILKYGDELIDTLKDDPRHIFTFEELQTIPEGHKSNFVFGVQIGAIHANNARARLQKMIRKHLQRRIMDLNHILLLYKELNKDISNMPKTDRLWIATILGQRMAISLMQRGVDPNEILNNAENYHIDPELQMINPTSEEINKYLFAMTSEANNILSMT